MVDPQLKQQIIHNWRAYTAGENPLWPHQVDAVNDNADFLDRPIDLTSETGKKFDGGSNRMATGVGKTYVKLGMATASGQKTLIITPYTKINTQIEKNYHTLAKKLGLNAEDIAIYDSKRSAADRHRAKDAKILITTDDSFRNLHEKGIVSGDPASDAYRPLVLLDESDMMLGDVTAGILKDHYIPNCVTLGFSATDQGVSEELFGGQPRIHNLPAPESITRGLLCHGVNTAAIAVTAESLDSEEQARLTQKKVSEELVDKFAKDKNVIHELIHFHGTYDDQEDSKHHKIGIGPIRRFPTLVKVTSVDASNRYAEAFNQIYGDGYAEAVSGDTPHEDQKDPNTGIVVERGLNSLLEDFNAGRHPRVIIFPQVLGRGVDIPNATVMLSVGDHIKLNTIEQNLGRVLRPGEEGYYERYGNDKIAFAANFFAKGARPALFSEVIEGPTIYSNKKPRKNPEPPTVEPIPDSLPPHDGDNADVEVTTDIKKLTQLYKDAELARMEREGVVPPGWAKFEDAVEITGIAPEKLQERLRTIHSGERYNSYGIKLQKKGGVVTCLPYFLRLLMKGSFTESSRRDDSPSRRSVKHYGRR